MPTVVLVLLVSLTAVAAVTALSLIRWREQKRLARAREAVRHADYASALSHSGELLRPWLSAGLMTFIASAIQTHLNILKQLGISNSKASLKAQENALLWLNSKPGNKQQLPVSQREAQLLQQVARQLLSYLRDAYKEGRLPASEARRYLHEVRLLNLRIAITVFEDKAGAAAKLHNHHQAIHFLKKAETLLTQQANLPDELIPILQDIRNRKVQHEQERQQNNQGTRLEAGTAMLSAEDDAWKKKKFD